MSDKIKLRVHKYTTPGGSMSRARYALDIRIVWMDDRFRNNPGQHPTHPPVHKVVLPNGRKFCIDSLSRPKLYRDGFTLLSWARHKDMYVCKRYFRTEQNRARFMADLEYALTDWAENWPGWSTAAATTPSQTVEVLAI